MPDTQDQSTQPTDLPGFFPGQTTPTQGGVGSEEQLKAMFGETGPQVPLEHNDAATNIASGIKAGMDPQPIDPQSKQLFDFMYSHKFKPVIVDGKPSYDANNQPIYEHKKDDTGQDIIDPKTGQPVLEKSDYYVSPARKILQGILANALTGGAPAISGHPDILREQRKQEWSTNQQVALQAAYKNAATNVQYARIQATNARQEKSLEFKRDHDTMTNQQFQQKYQMSKQRYDLSVKAENDAENARTKRLTGQKLDREETLLTRAYGPAAAQAQAEWLRDNPGMTQEDAAQAPWVKGRAKDLYDLSKPHEAANMALEKMVDAGEITPADLQNPAGIVNASQKSTHLTAQEKKDILLDQLPGQQKFGQQQANISLQNAGRIAGYKVLGQNKLTNEIVVEDENGDAHTVAVGPGQAFPKGGMTVTQAGQQNVVPQAEKGQAYQAADVSQAGNELMDLIDKNRDKLGNWNAIWKNATRNTPAGDPFINYFRSKVASYAALNPKVHGFRGQNAFQQFEELLGGPAKTADAFIGAIRGINETADIVRSMGTPGTSPMLPKNQGAGGKGQPSRVDFQRDPKNPGKFIPVPVTK